MASIKDLRSATSNGSLTQANITKLKELEEKKKLEAQAMMDAAIQRAEDADKAAAESKENEKTPFEQSQEAWGHEHHEVIVNGVNLSDSLHRRRETANRNARICQEYLEEQAIKKEMGEVEQTESTNNSYTTLEKEKQTLEGSKEDSTIDNNQYSLSEASITEEVDPDEAEIEKELELGGTNMNDNDVIEIDARGGNIPPTKKSTETVQQSAMSIDQLATPTEEQHKTSVKPSQVNIEVEDEQPIEEEAEATETTHIEEEVVAEEVEESAQEQQNISFVPSVKDEIAGEVKRAEDIDFNVDEEDARIAEEAEAQNNLTEMTEEELKAAVKKVQDDIAIKLGLRGTDDASKATVSDKTVTLTNVLNIFNQQSAPISKSADWVLVSAGKRFTMKEWTGPEIDSINKDTSGRNRFNTLREIFFAIYNHIISEKPSFEEWLKTTSFFDIDHLYMGIYAANYGNGKNFLPYNCEDANCRYPFLSDHHPMDDMMYFVDDEAKERFYKIKESTDTVDPYLYKPHIEQIYGSIGVEFKEPSIYDVVFESAVLDDAFSKKYADIIRFLVYIKNVHLLVNGQWHPVQCAVDKDNIVKTTKTRIITLAKIFAQLPSDAMTYMNKFIDQIDLAGNKVKYRLPEEVCPRCGKPVAKDPEENIFDGSRLVFSRHQLTRI